MFKNKKYLLLFIVFFGCGPVEPISIEPSNYSPNGKLSQELIDSLTVDIVSLIEYTGNSAYMVDDTWIYPDRAFYKKLVLEARYTLDCYKYDTANNKIYFLMYSHEPDYTTRTIKTFQGILSFDEGGYYELVSRESDLELEKDIIYFSRQEFEGLVRTGKLEVENYVNPYSFSNFRLWYNGQNWMLRYL